MTVVVSLAPRQIDRGDVGWPYWENTEAGKCPSWFWWKKETGVCSFSCFYYSTIIEERLFWLRAYSGETFRFRFDPWLPLSSVDTGDAAAPSAIPTDQAQTNQNDDQDEIERLYYMRSACRIVQEGYSGYQSYWWYAATQRSRAFLSATIYRAPCSRSSKTETIPNRVLTLALQDLTAGVPLWDPHRTCLWREEGTYQHPVWNGLQPLPDS